MAGSRLFVALVVVLVGALLSGTARAQGTDKSGEEWSHRIEPGDTLIGLHARLMRPSADWRVVQRLNRITDPRRLRPGSTLRIPVALLREEAAAAEVLHTHGEVWLERGGTARQALVAATPLLAGDVVGTGAQSSLSLRFADGSRAQLGPLGRLVLEQHVRFGRSGSVDTRLLLQSGAVEAQVPPAKPAPRFELRTPVVNLGVRGTEFRGRVDGERTLAEVVQGRVAAGAQALDAGFGTVATATGVAPPRVLLQAPELAGLPARIERLPLRLALPATAGARGYRAQIFDLAGDSPRLRLDGLFEEPLATWPDDLPDGRYELRVRASDGDGIEGQTARHALTLEARPEPPFLLRPRAGEKVADEEVTLAWARNPQAARYRLQVAGTADFAAPTVQRDDLTTTELRVPLPLGQHHWRVASVRADGHTGPWGDAQALERVERPPAAPPPPAPSAPGAQSARAVDEGITVNWAASPVPGASYQVQIARDAEFTQVVLDLRTARAEVQLPNPEAGTYHVRVRTLGADGRAGAFGGAQIVEVPRSLWWLWLLPLLLLF